MSHFSFVLLLVGGIVCIQAFPHPQSGDQGTSSQLQGGSALPPPQIDNSGGGGGGGRVQCKNQETAPGKFKFVCDGANPNDISLRSEHILWLTGPQGGQQVVDIEVPNYKVEELIKAGFKTGPGLGTLINILLRRPEQSYDAQVDQLNTALGAPSVNLQYEPVQKTLVHYPVDKPYSPLQGPLLPPPGSPGSPLSSSSSSSSSATSFSSLPPQQQQQSGPPLPPPGSPPHRRLSSRPFQPRFIQ